MLLKLIAFLYGYAEFEATGGYPERFLNLCAQQRRDIWDIHKIPAGYTGLVRAREYKHLRTSARRAGCVLRVKKKCGLPFFLRRFRRRTGLFAGLALFFLIIIYLSGFAWDINITGNQSLTSEQIVRVLEENGVAVGSRLSGIDEPNVRQKIMLQCPQIAWMSINPVGTTLNIDLTERVEAPKIDREPCNILASCDGVITDLKVYAGTPMVKKGDAVTKGQLLVSGAVELTNGSTVFRAAAAEITADTAHGFAVTLPKEQDAYIRTGAVKTRKVISFFGLKIPLYLGKVSEAYEFEGENGQVKIAGVPLPIEIATGRFYATSCEKTTVTDAQAEEYSFHLAEKQLADFYPLAEKQTFSTQKNDSSLEFCTVITFFCKENIAFSEKLLIF